MSVALTGAATESWETVDLHGDNSIDVLVRRPTAEQQMEHQAMQIALSRATTPEDRVRCQRQVDRFALTTSIVGWRGVLLPSGEPAPFDEVALQQLITEHGGFHQLLRLALAAFQPGWTASGNSDGLPSATSAGQPNSPETTSTGPSSESGSDSSDTGDCAAKQD